ncbi:MAG TPA: hypothetical protein H9717_00440 [Candidatus Eisenbergiella merdipullorum]|uniref:Flavodoxin family protein n=1 Tax=Candidatus Eisenbergiella merdipullorum TaxID=2838553 RepID=A0A9D2KYH8_9FIRM|nr:hypothetical protein [Candidatus Eisenbergiella merdipullorum]
MGDSAGVDTLLHGNYNICGINEALYAFGLNFTGCRSCMPCKRKDAERCRCYWKDDLTALTLEVYAADAMLIGMPICFGRPTSLQREKVRENTEKQKGTGP